ncbi:hypothetical protein GCM10017781_04100 [Deinococcus metalli]|uniref:Uncharacterized protein n=1 Tax=Deinococcus metalli TaxID=1141878 RepID=A0ABQ3JIJ1_9DEIO|nr:hypothetical protein GCM10017781_04100 [Deinococcus metalli]
MQINWPSHSEDAETLYVMLTHRIASAFVVGREFGCDPITITEMYLNGEQWQVLAAEFRIRLWYHVERIGLGNFDAVTAIRARFILSLLPREKPSEHDLRFEWLMTFAEHSGVPLPSFERVVKQVITEYAETHISE